MTDWLTDGLTDWLNRWTNEPRTIESMNQWILSTSSSKSAPISWFFLHCWSANKNSAPSRAHFANFIFQKCSDPLRFLAILKCKSSFRYSHVLIWPTSSSKTALNARVFLTCWSANRALATVLCTFCRQLSLIAASNKRNIDPTSATHGATSLKKHRVSRPIMFSPVNSRAPELLITSLLLWHANCSSSLFCRHDEKTSPASSSIIRKFSNLTSFDHSYATFNDPWSYSCHSYQPASRSQTGLFGRGTRSQQPTRWCRWSTCPCSSRLLPCNASSASKRPASMGFWGSTEPLSPQLVGEEAGSQLMNDDNPT